MTKGLQELEALRDFLLDNIPRSIEKLGRTKGPSQTLSNLSEQRVFNLVCDLVNEMRTRRPHVAFEMIYPFLMTLYQDNSSPNCQDGREGLKTLALNDFELLCYEVCVEIEQRYLNQPVSSTPRHKIVDRFAGPVKSDQARKKWQVRNVMAGDWSDSDVSCDEGKSEDELSSFSDTSQETILGRGSTIDSEAERIDEQLESTCAKLMKIFRDRSQYKVLLGYRDLEAQTILDLFQNLLDHPRVQNAKLKKELAVAIQRLSKKSALYPECFVLKNISLETAKDGSVYTVSSGKFGDVWRGSMRGQDVCLKVMRVYRNSKIHELLRAFSCEAVLWSQLRHTNVLPFYGVYQVDQSSHNRLCLVSPWMKDGNIDEYLAKEPNVNRIGLIIDVASGLKYLHAQSIIHGDLKGANVLVDSSGNARLADFGLSTMRDPEVLSMTTANSSSGGGGTVRWMAPELLGSYDSDEPINTKESDIYAFAGVNYEVFTGHVPFYEVFRDQTVILKVSRGERPSRPEQDVFLRTGMTEGIWRLMQDCWLAEPKGRPTASEALSRLSIIRKVVKKSKLAARQAEPPGRTTPTQTRPLSAAKNSLPLSPNLFRASFAQAGNLESQLQRKDLSRLLDIKAEPLLDSC